ncbi:MAG: hypothetical protein HJJLKODD_00849 [Phycisphaerae bacterium]|nr:hypothetical protein [Phycisphaerae bacterium]
MVGHQVHVLSGLSAGERGLVVQVQANGMAVRLREVGLCEGQELEVMIAGDPMVCRVGRSRFGIGRILAEAIAINLQG